MWAWIITLIRGWLPINGERIGKIIWVSGIMLIGFLIYHKIMHSADSQINQQATKGGVVSSTTIAPRISPGGCAHITVVEGKQRGTDKKKN